jgi:hypothetical protein
MKKHSFVYAAGLAVLLAAPLAASDDKAPGTTITGCVTTASDGKGFTLTETSQDPQTPGKTWTLVSTDGVDLSKYANHKVEIKGSSDSKSDMSPTTDRSSSEERATAAGSKLKLNVKSVKDISNTCS